MLFSFLFCVQILRDKVHAKYINRTPIDPNEWMFFLRSLEAGKGVISEEREDGLTAPSWIPATMWSKLDTLERLTGDASTLAGLIKSVNSGGGWDTFTQNDGL